MKNKVKTMELIVHGIFLVLGLITVAAVLLISVYLVISGIPAIQEIGFLQFMFGKEWKPTVSEPEFGIFKYIKHKFRKLN